MLSKDEYLCLFRKMREKEHLKMKLVIAKKLPTEKDAKNTARHICGKESAISLIINILEDDDYANLFKDIVDEEFEQISTEYQQIVNPTL